MPPRWDLFAAVAVLVALALLGMARATERALTGGTFQPEFESDADREGAAPRPDPATEALRPAAGAGPLLVNVALSHGLVGTLLVAVAWYAEIPPPALGLDAVALGALPVGVGVGLGLSAANEAAQRLARLAGVEGDERLRELLAPDGALGWAVLLLVALPAVAVVEELLFRGALVGALAAGYGLSPWLLAAASSVLFGLGHGLQGPAGIAASGALGFALAAAFVLTGSLPAVIVAHYVVNAVEFAVHEGFAPSRGAP